MGGFARLFCGAVLALILVPALPGCAAPSPAPVPPASTPTAVTPAPSTTAPPVPAATSAPLPAATTRLATPATTAAPVTRIQWLGQSAFLLTSSRGTRVLIDPFNASTGYPVTPLDGVDAVLVTHEHGDHNNVKLATGDPAVIRGLTATGWNTVDQAVKDLRVFSPSPAIPVYHDNQQGAQRGRNTIFVIEVDGLRLAHLGDLGHVLDAAAVKALGKLDVVIVPVGGVYTLDAPGATQVISQLEPRIVVPMHYKTPRMQASWPGSGVEPFLAGKRVERPAGSVLSLSVGALPSSTTVVVLNYE